MSNKTIKIIFFGDLVGKPGRFAVKKFLAEHKYDFVIANVENASHGFGLTEKNYNELSAMGIDCMTSGNHIWDKKEIFSYIDKAEKLIRPINYPVGTKGVGSRVFDCGDYKIGVMNILGKVFINIVDFHAEATAEKICFAKYCSQLGVSVFLGTHTHVQTADECIMNNMGYITDVGFCGAYDSVIGMEYKNSLAHFTTNLPSRYEVADSQIFQTSAVELEIDPLTGHTVAIKRILRNEDRNEV